MDNYKRQLYTEMPMDICKTLTVGKIVFMSGTEALDFRKGGTIAESMDEQIETVVFKMDETLKAIGLSLANMVKHTIYMTKGSADPIHVIEKFHTECHKYAPNLKTQPSTGTLVVVDGLALKDFKFEVDAIAVIPD
jgi:enamine deaminase RidA (YjgF/YER057c/UK114 family)